MTPELQRYYENRISMMASQGWRDLMEDVKKMLDATDRISIVKNEAELNFRKGEISMMNWMLAQKEMTEQAYKELTDAETSP